MSTTLTEHVLRTIAQEACAVLEDGGRSSQRAADSNRRTDARSDVPPARRPARPPGCLYLRAGHV
jgi:hypothetical protein